MAVYLGKNKVDMIGGTPVVTDGIDTSDATATASDMAAGVTAYVNGEKITGTLPHETLQHSYSDGVDVIRTRTSNGTFQIGLLSYGSNEERRIVGDGAAVITYISASRYGDAIAEDVVAGKTFTSAAGVKITGTATMSGGIDTSDATATAEDILNGKTAYVNGQKIVGTGVYNAFVNSTLVNQTGRSSGDDVTETGNDISFKTYPFNNDYKVTPDTYITTYVSKTEFGDAIASDVLSGKTFTSSAGLKVTGTASPGLIVKTGTTTSTTINTGLSSVSYFVLYKTAVSSTGLIQAIYDGSTTNMTYCSAYSTSTWGTKTYAVGTASPTLSGGTITWNISAAASGGLSASTTYNWIAFGTE